MEPIRPVLKSVKRVRRGKAPANESLLSHRVCDGLERMILRGQLKPAQKLSQQHLAQQFGVGAGVVREALIELRSRGLVKTEDNRGAFVSELDPERLLEAFDIRELHEGLAARLCCIHGTRAQMQQLRVVAAEQRDMSHRDFAQGMKLDRSLHRSLLEIAGHQMLIRLAQQYQSLTKVFHIGHEAFETFPKQILRHPDDVYREHLAVLTAIEDGREEEAERLMRMHVRAGKEEARKLLEAGLVLHRLDE